MGKGAYGSTTLEGYKEFRPSQLIKENIGRELNDSTRKSFLAENGAYEIQYSYKPEGNDRKWFVRESCSVVGGKVYQIQSYAHGNVEPKFRKTFETKAIHLSRDDLCRMW